MSKLGDNIRLYRKAAKLTQEKLSECVDVTRLTIARYESGEIVPSASVLSRLADALGVTPNILLGQNDMTDDEREIWELRESVRNDPERRYLFSMARDADIKQIRQAIAITVPYRCSPTPPPKI